VRADDRGMTTIVIAVLGWIVLGAGMGFLEARRGHWVKLPLVAALIGPFALPLIIVARQREAEARPRWLAGAGRGPGELEVLVGYDGTDGSMTALDEAVRLLGPQVRRLTLATVLDYDTAAPHDAYLHTEPWAEETAAEAGLAEAARAVVAATSVAPATVVLAGRPADALERHAIDHHCDVVVLGPRRHGAAHTALGSCAAQLARRSRVPILLVPAAVGAPAGAVVHGAGSLQLSETPGT
jgi:nucleotide-binding universal stress UspA family protein